MSTVAGSLMIISSLLRSITISVQIKPKYTKHTPDCRASDISVNDITTKEYIA